MRAESIHTRTALNLAAAAQLSAAVSYPAVQTCLDCCAALKCRVLFRAEQAHSLCRLVLLLRVSRLNSC